MSAISRNDCSASRVGTETSSTRPAAAAAGPASRVSRAPAIASSAPQVTPTAMCAAGSLGRPAQLSSQATSAGTNSGYSWCW